MLQVKNHLYASHSSMVLLEVNCCVCGQIGEY
jgi:hypothetical protein